MQFSTEIETATPSGEMVERDRDEAMAAVEETDVEGATEMDVGGATAADERIEVDDAMTMEQEMEVDEEEACVIVCFFLLMIGVMIAQLDGRSFRGPREQEVTVRTDFWKTMKQKRSRTAYCSNVRCTPDAFDALCRILEPMYNRMFSLPARNTQYSFDMRLAVLLAYYGNGCGLDGGGIGSAAAKMGMSRTAAMNAIDQMETLLMSMIDDVIYFPCYDDEESWNALVHGFEQRGGLFPNVAGVFDGTIVKTQRPKDFQVVLELTADAEDVLAAVESCCVLTTVVAAVV